MPSTINSAGPGAVSAQKLTFRVMEFGVTSYWPKTFDAAKDIASVVMARNGCGMIEERQADGLWKITHRYEPWYGLVPTNAELAK